jgi:CDP-diacylglycerol--glycerol-3-phosphate 3-phosphatidyltransferase
MLLRVPSPMTPFDRAALLLLGGVFLTIPVYAATRRSRALDPEVVRRSETVLISRWTRNWLIWLLSPLERAGIRGRIPPDAFTWAGLALAAGSGVAFALGAFSAAAWLILLSGATDIVDGRIARALSIDSRYGAFLDAALDRYGEVLVFLGLLWYFAAFPLAVMATFLAMAGSLLVSYTRACGETLGIDFDGGLMQRAERMVGVSLAGIADRPLTRAFGWQTGTLLAFVVALVAVGSLATAIYRGVRVARELRSRSA